MWSFRFHAHIFTDVCVLCMWSNSWAGIMMCVYGHHTHVHVFNAYIDFLIVIVFWCYVVVQVAWSIAFSAQLDFSSMQTRMFVIGREMLVAELLFHPLKDRLTFCQMRLTSHLLLLLETTFMGIFHRITEMFLTLLMWITLVSKVCLWSF